jgi:hypothetical protein
MNMKKYLILLTGALAFVFFGCEKKGYLIDGGLHNPKVDMTTYDYLKTNRVFDTLVILIDKAGLKETINGDVTFFAPTDFSVVNYVTAKRGDMLGIDPFSNFKLESIPVATLRDTLKMYIIPGKINRSDMTKDGKIYTTLMGNKVHVALIPVQDANYSGIVKTWPEYVYFTKIVGAGLDVPGTVPPAAELDVRNVCQTSGIITNNGILHVLENSHTMFYFVQTHFPSN